MEKILGRSDDMLIIRGVNVFPSQIESVILNMEEFAPHYKIFVDRVNNLDQMEFWVEVREEYFTDELEKMLAMKKKLSSALHSVLGIAAPIKLVEPMSIAGSAGQA